jgi:hypothetical protein
MSYSGYNVDIDIKVRKVLDSINYVDMQRDNLVIVGYHLESDSDVSKALKIYDDMLNTKIDLLRETRVAHNFFPQGYSCRISGFKVFDLNDFSINDMSLDEFGSLGARGVKKLDDGSYKLFPYLPMYYKGKYLGHVDGISDLVCILLEDNYMGMCLFVDPETYEIGARIGNPYGGGDAGIDISGNVSSKLNKGFPTYTTSCMKEHEFRDLKILGRTITKPFKVANEPRHWIIKALDMLKLPNMNNYLYFGKSVIIDISALGEDVTLIPDGVEWVYFCDYDFGFRRNVDNGNGIQLVLPPSVVNIDRRVHFKLNRKSKLIISSNCSDGLLKSIYYLFDLYESREGVDYSRSQLVDTLKNNYSKLVEFY